MSRMSSMSECRSTRAYNLLMCVCSSYVCSMSEESHNLACPTPSLNPIPSLRAG